MPKIKVQCPAKINYTLKVTGKRSDGFHNIESVMQTIALFDYLTIAIDKVEGQTEIILSGNSAEIPYNEKNLVYKAAKSFLEELHSDINYRVLINIEKNIPVAAGLAGGSTDAAGTLYGLNKLLGNKFDSKVIHELCARLGSDLNFCLEGGTRLATGRGEILKPLEYEEKFVSLIKPLKLGISAKEAYTKFALKNFEKMPGRENFVNDLEWAVFDDYKELQIIKQNYPDSIMSGSGSTYYRINGVFENIDGFWVKNDIKTTDFGVVSI